MTQATGNRLDGMRTAVSWSGDSHQQLERAIANNPHEVWRVVRRDLLEIKRTPSRENCLLYGETARRVGRGTVIENMNTAAWSAVYMAAGLNRSEADIVDLVTQLGRKVDAAFQLPKSTWKNSKGEEISGPVFSWDLWDPETKGWAQED